MSGNTEFIVRTNQPSIGKFLSRAQNAYFTIISSNLHSNSNIVYIGNDGKANELYISLDTKIMSFNHQKTQFYKPTHVTGNVLPLSHNQYDIVTCNIYLSSDQIAFNDALMKYDSQNHTICFLDNDPNNFQRDLEINAKELKIIDPSGYYSILSTSSTGAIISSYRPDSTLFKSINIGRGTSAIIPEEGSNLYFTEARVQNVLSRFNLNANNASIFFINLIDETSNNVIYNIKYITRNNSNYINDYFVALNATLSNINNNLQSNLYNYLNEASNTINIINQDATKLQELYTKINSSSNITHFIDKSSNQIIKDIYHSSNTFLIHINDNYRELNSNFIITSNQLVDIISNTSNTIINIINSYIPYNSNEYSNALAKTVNNININNNYTQSYALNVSNNIIQNLDNLLNNIGVSSNYQINTSKIVNSYFVNTSNNIDEFLKNITLDDLQHNSSISSKLIVNNYVNALTTSNITTIGNIVPFCNLTFDLGSSNYKWRHLYLSGNSIYLDNIIISEDSAREGITIKNKNNEFVELVVSELKLYDDATQNYVSISSSNGQITATSFSNDSSILVNKPNLTTDVIPEALNASNLYYKPERVADIINSSNVISSNYIKNVGVSINSFLNNLTTDQIPEGTYKKWITNNLYTGDLSITKILTTSNLCIYHHSSVQTSNISINNLILSSDTPTLNIYQNSNQNIFELYGLSNNIVLTHDGKLGLGTTLPTQSLDVYGSIHFTGFINNIHSNQLTYLSGIKNNIIAQLSEKNINISNYVINTSNDIATNALQIISIHQSNIDKLINEISTNNSNYLEQISHSYKDKFVIIYDTIRSLESRISAYTENIRQIIEGNFQLTCNEILSNYTEINTKNPLLISNTSNSISKHIESTFLTTSNRIYDYSVKSKWSSINNNIYLNARVGINTIPSDTLDVNGNIHFKKHINNISSNEFSCLLGLISPIEEQIDTLNLVASNNISNISVNIDKDVLKKYNYTINLTSNLDYYTSNYISNIKQNVETNINIKFNELEQYLNNFSGPSQWNPLQYDKIYFANNVGIGTSLINNRIDVFGGDVNVVNSNVKRGDSKYQLLRWYDSPLYYTSVDKYIVYKEGQVGIGTTPIANLHVGNNTTNTLGPIVYFNKSTSLTSTSTVFNDVCAIFDSSIVVNGSIVAASDIRIKKNIIELNDDSALQKIMAISPKTYEYIDKSKGSSNIYGFIAQQINVVIPEAVSLQKEYIPNIYQYVLCNSNLIEMQDIAMSNILNIDTKIKIIDNTENVHYCKVISRDLEYNNIVIDKIFNANIFLYGTEVDDFHVVDKQYIYTLNVCATQKIVEKLNEAKTRLMALQNRYKNLYQLSN
jgi:hypothetical protein